MYKIVFFLTLMSIFSTKAKPLIIAHAGGGINGFNYSNSIEALDKNYAAGFRYFELDFSWTSDKQLVCLHDWQKRFKKLFGFKIKNALTLQQFQQQLDVTNGLHPCTLKIFAAWVKKHPDSKIITDVKFNNIKAIQLIVDQYPEIQSQLIPQFYQPSEYQKLKDMNFNDLIWILYQYEGSKASIIKHAKDMDLIAISMHKRQARKKFAQQLIKQGKSIYVYTVNRQSKFNKLVNKYNVSGVYTDFLNYK